MIGIVHTYILSSSKKKSSSYSNILKNVFWFIVFYIILPNTVCFLMLDRSETLIYKAHVQRRRHDIMGISWDKETLQNICVSISYSYFNKINNRKIDNCFNEISKKIIFTPIENFNFQFFKLVKFDEIVSIYKINLYIVK